MPLRSIASFLLYFISLRCSIDDGFFLLIMVYLCRLKSIFSLEVHALFKEVLWINFIDNNKNKLSEFITNVRSGRLLLLEIQ